MERLEQEEQERCEIDRQEALIKAENRRIQIERANKMLYDETDRVKSFHGKLMLSDVMQEREQQIKYKKTLSSMTKKQDDAFIKSQKAAVEIAESAESRKLEERQARAYAQRDAQLTQLEELKDRSIKQKLEDRAAGDMVKKRAEEGMEMEKQRVKDRVLKDKQMHYETMRANEALQAIKAMEKQKELEEEQKMYEFARRKEQLVLERKMRAAAKQKEKEDRRNKMVRLMEDDLMQRRDNQDKVLVKQQAQAVEKDAMDQAQRAEIKRIEQLAIDRSREQQMQIKYALKQRGKLEEAELIIQTKIQHEEMKEAAEKKRVDQFVRNKTLQTAHLRQIDRKSKKEAYDVAREKAEAESMRLILEEDDELFKQYTGVCMDEWAREGKSLVPMQLEIAKQQVAALTGYTPAKPYSE